MTPAFSTPHVTVYCGHVLDVLADLPDESVDCCVTSPPYWGLRDYGTATWEGGDPACDHRPPDDAGATTKPSMGQREHAGRFSGMACWKCGATRIDAQLGLEPTPDAYVQNMVAVFREVRRVLRTHGTLYLNLGDSYAANRSYQVTDSKHVDVGNTKASSVPAGLKPKDLVGIPWRVAFALQANGWYLRSDIIWAKPNPKPESVTDRPTKSHEYVFLLSKSERYFFDQEAVREAVSAESLKHVRQRPNGVPTHGRLHMDTNCGTDPAGRNIRSVWQIATQPYGGAHFAVFPRELPERCIKAGTPEQVCSECGKARERTFDMVKSWREDAETAPQAYGPGSGNRTVRSSNGGMSQSEYRSTGYTDCGHDAYTLGTVLDPFAGSGTTLAVARDLGRKSIGIELNPEYVRLIEKRCGQLALDLGA